MTIQLKCLISICIVTIATSVFSQDDDKISDKMKERLEELKKQEGSMEFYGKVIDQYEKPVAEAKVFLSIQKASIFPSAPEILTSITDEQGLFYIDNVKGGNLFVKNIERAGYIVDFKQDISRGFSYRKDYNPRHVPNKSTPVVFHMRKRGENPTYLMTNRDFNVDMSSGEKLVRSFIDLRNDWKEKHEDGDYEKDFLSKHHDIKVSATFDKEKSDWTVTFTASGENGGFVLDDKFLSEAPEDGYMKEFTIIQHVATEKEREEYNNSKDKDKWDKFQKLTEFKFKGKYLYVKSRNPAIYTRMELTEARADDSEDIRIDANTATNPYGERNLEEMDMPYGMGKYFYPQTIEAFLEGKRPIKPEVKKLWEEYKETHEQVENPETGKLIWKKKKG